MGWDGLVSIVTEVWARRPKYRISLRDRVKFFLIFSKISLRALGPTQTCF